MILSDLSPEAYREATEYLAALGPDWSRHIERPGLACTRPRRGVNLTKCWCERLPTSSCMPVLPRQFWGGFWRCFRRPVSWAGTVAGGCTANHARLWFSASKMATIQGIAQGRLDGLVPSREEALAMADEALIERLVALRGVGRWTVEMLLIYSLARSDVLPVDDFGVREGYRRLKGLDKAPTPAQMRSLGGGWRPYRTVAAWYLWRA